MNGWGRMVQGLGELGRTFRWPSKLEWRLARRYLRSRRGARTASLNTVISTVISAWLGLHFDESHDLPDWYGPAYWWSTQWVAPLGYAVAGLSFLAFSMREKAPHGDA
jgi:hypothetical protein